MELQIHIEHTANKEHGPCWAVTLTMPSFDKPLEVTRAFPHSRPGATHTTSTEALEATEMFIEGARAVFALMSRGAIWGSEGSPEMRSMANAWDHAEQHHGN